MAVAHNGWRKRRVRLALLLPVLLIAVVAFVVASAAVYLGSLASSFDSMRKTASDSQVFPSAGTRPAAATGSAAKAQNILLIGVDTGTSAPTSVGALSGAETEALVLLHVPSDGKHMYAVSMQRNTWVSIPGYGQGTLASAIADGGLPLAVQVVEQLTTVRIDHVAVVSYAGFPGLTNALGSVGVNNPAPFTAGDSTFARGTVSLNGAQALAYVRGARSAGLSEPQQVQTQQAYLSGVLKKILSAGTLLNPIRLHSTVAAISPYLLVDRELDAVYIANLTLELRSLRGSDVEFLALPVGSTGTEGGAPVVHPDATRLAELAGDLEHDTVGQYR